jgi:hypothetical protein
LEKSPFILAPEKICVNANVGRFFALNPFLIYLAFIPRPRNLAPSSIEILLILFENILGPLLPKFNK